MQRGFSSIFRLFPLSRQKAHTILRAQYIMQTLALTTQLLSQAEWQVLIRGSRAAPRDRRRSPRQQTQEVYQSTISNKLREAQVCSLRVSDCALTPLHQLLTISILNLSVALGSLDNHRRSNSRSAARRHNSYQFRLQETLIKSLNL